MEPSDEARDAREAVNEGDVGVGCLLFLMVAFLLLSMAVDTCGDAAANVVRAAKCDASAAAMEVVDGTE